jgi:elongation factor 2
MKCQPLQEGIPELIEGGKISPKDDPKVRGKILSE